MWLPRRFRRQLLPSRRILSEIMLPRAAENEAESKLLPKRIYRSFFQTRSFNHEMEFRRREQPNLQVLLSLSLLVRINLGTIRFPED